MHYISEKQFQQNKTRKIQIRADKRPRKPAELLGDCTFTKGAEALIVKIFAAGISLVTSARGKRAAWLELVQCRENPIRYLTIVND